MTSLRVICGLGPPQSKILAMPMTLTNLFWRGFRNFVSRINPVQHANLTMGLPDERGTVE